VSLSSLIAKHLRDVHGGGNWTAVNLKDLLADITWQQATTPVGSCHTIAELVFHTNYFVAAVLRVLRGGPLDAHDRYSFDLPPIGSQQEWESLLNKTFTDAETCARLVEELPESRLEDDFVDGKYGSYYRNLFGIIEHTHYHLGQIALLRKMLAQSGDN